MEQNVSSILIVNSEFNELLDYKKIKTGGVVYCLIIKRSLFYYQL